MRVALIGPRGSGKSTIALLLAEHLNYPLASTDALVESTMGAPISLIVESKGWHSFRESETRCLQGIVDEGAGDLILDCGGGIIESAANREMLAQMDCVVFLNGEPQELVKRLKDEMEKRPPLTQSVDELEEVKRILSRRLPLYRQAADFEVDTTAIAPKEIAENIYNSLNFIEG